MQSLWRFHKKLKIELPYDPAIPLLGIYQEETFHSKSYMDPMLIAALLTRAKTWKQLICPLTDEWVKIWYIYTVEYSHKKE